MKTITRFILAFALLCPIAAHATLGFVQAASNSNGSTSITTTYGTNNGAGDLLTAAIADNAGSGGQTVSSITDAQGNTWQLACASPGQSYSKTWIYYAMNAKAGSNSVSVTVSGGTQYDLTLTVAEYSGALTSNAFEGCSGGSGTSSPQTSNYVGTATTNDLLFSLAYDDNGTAPTMTPTSGFTSRNQTAGPSFGSLAVFDNFPVAAGLYSNSVSFASPGSGPSFHVIVAAFRSQAPAQPLSIVRTATGAASSATSVTVTVTNGGGHALVLGVAWTGGSGVPTSVSDTAGNTWVLGGCANGFSGARSDCFYYVPSCIAGANTVTISYSSSRTWSAVMVEYSGQAANLVGDAFSPVIESYNSGSVTTPSVYPNTTGEQLIAFAFSTHTTTYGFAASGFTQEAISAANSQSAAILDGPATPAVANSAQIYNAGNLDDVLIVSLRSTVPTIGFGQGTNASASSASLPVPYRESVIAGDALLVTVYGSNNTDAGDSYIPQISDNVGDSFKVAPIGVYSAPPIGALTFYCPNAMGGATTVTIADSGGSQNYDVYLTEVRGLATGTPLVNATKSASNTSTAVNTGSLTLPAGSYYLYSYIGDAASNTYSGGSGWIPRTTGPGDYYVREVWDQTVGAGTYSNPITTAGSLSIPSAGVIAFATANQTGAARVVQVTSGGGFAGYSSSEKEFVVPNTANNAILVIGEWQPGGTPSLSDSNGNSYTLLLGGSGYNYGAWIAFGVTGGLNTVTLSTGYVTALSLVELSGVTGVDVKNSQDTTGTTIGTGNITTNFANELIESFGVESDSSCAQPTFSYTGSGWTNRNESTSHCGTLLTLEQFASATGTFANSFSSSASYPIAAGIIGLRGSAPTPQNQPNVSIISELIERWTAGGQ